MVAGTCTFDGVCIEELFGVRGFEGSVPLSVSPKADMSKEHIFQANSLLLLMASLNSGEFVRLTLFCLMYLISHLRNCVSSTKPIRSSMEVVSTLRKIFVL